MESTWYGEGVPLSSRKTLLKGLAALFTGTVILAKLARDHESNHVDTLTSVPEVGAYSGAIAYIENAGLLIASATIAIRLPKTVLL